MSRNVEIKAVVSDISSLRLILRSLTTTPPVTCSHRDIFFAVHRGRLKLREFSGGLGEIIFYERPDQAGAKVSTYDRCECADPKAVSAVLGRALGVRGVVEKRRELFEIGRTRIHLDEVCGLGSFLEIEVVLDDSDTTVEGERIANELLTVLGIPESALVASAYIDMLERKSR